MAPFMSPAGRPARGLLRERPRRACLPLGSRLASGRVAVGACPLVGWRRAAWGSACPWLASCRIRPFSVLPVWVTSNSGAPAGGLASANWRLRVCWLALALASANLLVGVWQSGGPLAARWVACGLANQEREPPFLDSEDTKALVCSPATMGQELCSPDAGLSCHRGADPAWRHS